jgi:pimeloyl-ACP methyl ester carboxylesterase
MDAPLTDRFFTRNGTSLRYRDAGSGPPVMLVHGWTLDLEMWDSQVDSLRGSFRLIALDRRGFGLSRGNPSIDQDCEDLQALCRHLGLERIAVVGMSQGARAVMKFATTATHVVSCVVLDGPPDLLGAPESDAPVPEQYRVLARAEGMEAFRRAWIHHPLLSLRTRDPSAHRHLRSIIERYPGRDLAASALASTVPGPLPLDSFATPTLIITGEHDLPERIEVADALAKRLPSAERAIIPDAGHLPNFDNPVAYTGVLRTFLERHASAPN